MLLLPGLMCDTRIWAPQLAAFPDAVAVPDYPGCRGLQEMARHAGIPLGRVGKAEEFADTVAFLLSPRGGYISGAALNVDGGLSAVV